MASIVADGVVLTVPYIIVRGIITDRPVTLSVVGPDPRFGGQTGTREIRTNNADMARDLFLYTGDVLTYSLAAQCGKANYITFARYTVNPSTGVVTLAATVSLPTSNLRQVAMTVSAINASTGVATVSLAYS